MNEEEIKSLIGQLKGVGLEDKEIMDVFYKAFQKGEMGKDDLETLANAMGYGLSKEFAEDSHAEPIEGGEGPSKGPTEEELEDIRSIKPEESKEGFEKKAEDLAEKMPGGDEEDSGESDESEGGDQESDSGEGADESGPDASMENGDGSDSGESDEESWKEAQKLFRI